MNDYDWKCNYLVASPYTESVLITSGRPCLWMGYYYGYVENLSAGWFTVAYGWE